MFCLGFDPQRKAHKLNINILKYRNLYEQRSAGSLLFSCCRRLLKSLTSLWLPTGPVVSRILSCEAGHNSRLVWSTWWFSCCRAPKSLGTVFSCSRPFHTEDDACKFQRLLENAITHFFCVVCPEQMQRVLRNAQRRKPWCVLLQKTLYFSQMKSIAFVSMWMKTSMIHSADA